MKSNYRVSRIALLATGLVVTLLLVALSVPRSMAAEEEQIKKAPHRVVAMYFHRTKRCDTCKKISAHIEQAVNKVMQKEKQAGQLSLHMIDFQNAKNAKYTKYYKIAGPTLVLADVHKGKITQWKRLPKVWSLVSDEKKFLAYVQEETRGYLESE